MCFFKLSEYKAHQKQKRGALIKVAGILKIINIYIYIYIYIKPKAKDRRSNQSGRYFNFFKKIYKNIYRKGQKR